MPRYFFDVQDGRGVDRDRCGVVLPDVSHVWEIAVPMVEEIATARPRTRPHDRVSRPHDRVSVIVRDASDTVVYRSDHVVG